MKKRLVSLKKQLESSSEDEDSDVERNFALLTARGQTEEEEQHHGGGHEEEESGGGDEDEEGSDGRDETEFDDDGKTKGDEDEDGSDEDEDGSDEDEDGSDEDEDGSGGASETEECNNEAERAGGSHDVQTKEAIRKELSNMSFEDIERLQNTVGTKVYNEVAYGSSSKTPEARTKKRLNKNRPMEISAKKPAPFLRQVVPVRKPTLRDPRFDDLSGEYKPEIFEKTYKFINDIRHREKEVVQKKLKRIKKSSQRKEKLQVLLKRMENQERARKSREQQRERELQLKRQQRERAGQGGQPFFFKKSDVKKLQLAEKYQELKKSGKLENFLSKKRKRNATKDRRKLPRQLQSEKASGH